MVRNPLEVVPSMISEVLATCVYSLDQTKETARFQDVIYETARFFYAYPLKRLDCATKSSFLIINYEDLINHPVKTIRAVYDYFGFHITEDFVEILQEEETKAKKYISKHAYSLNQFNLSSAKIVADFHATFQRFGFDTR